MPVELTNIDLISPNGTGVITIPGDVDITGTPAPTYKVNGTPLSFVTAPAGANGQIQFNNAGAFGANSNFVFDSTNVRVGIGTAAPQSKLHIMGGTDLVNIDNALYIYDISGTKIIGHTAYGLQIQFQSARLNLQINGDGKTAQLAAYSSGGALARIQASADQYIGLSTDTVERMRIDQQGRVGIGTTAPRALLDTGASLAPIKIATYSDAGGANGIGVSAAGLTFGAYIDPNIGVPQMLLTGTGRLGIMQTPQSRLDVGGRIICRPNTPDPNPTTGNGLGIWASTNLGSGMTLASGIESRNYAPLQYVPLLFDGNPLRLNFFSGADVISANINITGTTPSANAPLGSLGFINTYVAANQRIAMIQSWTDLLTDSGQLTFQTANAGAMAERMRIDSQGRVGIGTVTPAYKLEVNGDVNITGKLYINGVAIT